MRSSCLSTQAASSGFIVVFLLLCGTYAIAHPMQEHHLLTSFNGSKIVFRIPKNYGINDPIFSIRLLRPPDFANPTDYGKGYNLKSKNICGRTKRSTRIVYEDLSRGRKRKENRRWSSDELFSLESNSNSGGINKSYRRHKDDEKLNRDWKGSGGEDFRKDSSRSQFKWRDFLKLATKQKDLFHLRYSWQSSMISVYLKRNLVMADYTDIRQSSLKFQILERVPPTEDCVKKRNSPKLEEDSGTKYQVLLEVVLYVINTFNCNQLTERMCMLPEDFIQLQQWENEPPGSLLTLPSLKELCPGITRNIKIKMEELDENLYSPELEFDSLKNEIRTTEDLDRELRGSMLNFTVNCDLRLLKNSKASKIRKKAMGSLLVKDVDDSPPMRLKARNVVWKINDNVEHLDDKLMIIDPDIENGDFEIKVIGDTYNLIHVESQSKFLIQKEVCAEQTSTFPSPLTAECTIITPELVFDKYNAKWYPQNVKFSLVFTDTTLVSKTKKKKAQVIYDLTLILNNLEQNTALHSGMNISLKNDEDLPLETNITIYRPLQIYSRLLQMLQGSQELYYQTIRFSPPTFWVSRDIISLGIDITPILGILHITDPEKLQDFIQNSGRLEVVVKRGSNFTSSVFIELGEEIVSCEDEIPRPSYITVASPTSCAIHSYRNRCEKSCGVGSLAAKCSWRSSNGTYMTDHYATCSPDFTTCPDHHCDELEIKHKNICPQDCVEEHMTKGSKIIMDTSYEPPRGIIRAFGVCTCNDYCQCFPAGQERNNVNERRGHRSQEIMTPGSTPGSCGTACQVGLSIGIVLTIFLLVFVFCRRRKDCGMKFKDSDLSHSHYPSDFMDDHSSSYASGPSHGEAHTLAIHAVHNIHNSSSRHNHLNNNNDHDFAADLPLINFTVDHKWEFPRNQLIIEQTLGEGEFGKVMKGRATSLGGQPGTSIVAVKMLKNNSTAAELGDLMSEYQLLKEVNHPNVIKLLGACTTKSGPIYLLIEYCKYGSLRSYLRKSRHFELENRVGSTPLEESPCDYQITPKHLLSFAWQVCKGMAYLGTVKLVHRDLAARNVLLAEGRICKISDFGLTRDIYESDLYFKRSKGRVPVKWMAIESLVDHVYTSKSDIWGFGVLLWELITMGSSPYPGVTPERLFTLLQSGYRMEKPENCSDDLYQIMKSCWHKDPSKRPSFNFLVSTFERMIETDVEYLELRSLIVTNRTYFEDSIAANDILPDIPKVQIKNASVLEPKEEKKEPEPILNKPKLDETRLDQDSYLLAKPSLPLETSTMGNTLNNSLVSPKTHMTFNGTNIHAHNPAYSPSRTDSSHPLQYSSLENGPDEEEDVGITIEDAQDGCRSEADSDSGRATGDSGYLTEEGRKCRESRISTSSNALSFDKPLGSARESLGSYSPLNPQELEDEQDTSEDFEERQELLTEDIMICSETTFSNGSKCVPRKEKRKPSAVSNSSSTSSSSGLSSGDFVNSQRRRSPVQV